MSVMQNIMLAQEEDDDPYSGYEYNSIAAELEEDPEFHRIVRTGYAQRPPVPVYSSVMPSGSENQLSGTTGLHTRGGNARPATGLAPDSIQSRPMTGITAAGFKQGIQFDPLNQSKTMKGSVSLLERSEDTHQDMTKKLEKAVNTLVEESTQAGAMNDLQTALDKAREAARKERILCKQREQAQLTDQINLDLTYSVLFNLGYAYHAAKNYQGAYNTYDLIVKKKMFSTGGRLRVNMGNICVEQGKYAKAIKMYRMALDQIPDVHKGVRFRILQNIGTVFVKMGQYADAITSFEHIMEEKADFKTALNLLVCYYAVSDSERMKKCFHRMLQISIDIDEDRYYPTVEDDSHHRVLLEAIKNDTLRKLEKEKKETADKTILTAAKLIAPVIEATFAVGFDWCIEQVKESQYSELSNELEVTKGLTFLKEKDIPKAIETFVSCTKKESKMAGAAATNLSFIFYLENESLQAVKHADIAIALDRYSAYALVNKGCCAYSQGDYEKAKDYFQESLSVEATCTEALFNLGLVHKKLGGYQEALECYTKLHSIFKNSAQVIYHLADLFDKLDDFDQSTGWFLQLISLVPTDPRVLQRVGEMYDSDDDRSQAFQYHYESFRYSPTNIDVISWLGAYYMESRFADKATYYFERAALIQPSQINWQLMVASCHRKSGNYQQALQCYKQIHKQFPENVDCLRFMVRLCNDLGLKEARDYSLMLRKVEKSMEARRQRELSSGSGKSSGGSSGSRGHGSTISTNSSTIRARIQHSTGVDSCAKTDDGNTQKRKEINASYSDPLGGIPERPKTATRQKQDDFEYSELGDLLPE